MNEALELKLAKLLTVVQEHVQGGWCASDNPATGHVTERDVQRELDDPDIANWLHMMREERGAPHRRIK